MHSGLVLLSTRTIVCGNLVLQHMSIITTEWRVRDPTQGRSCSGFLSPVSPIDGLPFSLRNTEAWAFWQPKTVCGAAKVSFRPSLSETWIHRCSREGRLPFINAVLAALPQTSDSTGDCGEKLKGYTCLKHKLEKGDFCSVLNTRNESIFIWCVAPRVRKVQVCGTHSALSPSEFWLFLERKKNCIRAKVLNNLCLKVVQERVAQGISMLHIYMK